MMPGASWSCICHGREIFNSPFHAIPVLGFANSKGIRWIKKLTTMSSSLTVDYHENTKDSLNDIFLLCRQFDVFFSGDLDAYLTAGDRDSSARRANHTPPSGMYVDRD